MQNQALNKSSEGKQPSPRPRNPGMTPAEVLKLFWEAPADAYFSQEIIAPVIGHKPKTLECDRWRGRGIPYRKCGGRVLYCKADVIAWLEGHDLVASTSEYAKEDSSHGA
jgi:hypothetical protein